ncbi:hypothetical protein N657DRAFT_563923 [Parathielavia appendiculata]|uniref:N(6)-L-threonylcarbamoyladenine synthase n=1 Tax=Parathielavia appendiculata TaxID=2587402 RepID=A0AAN6U8J0_9PEZI|nr:hypothetical protein N657DRAFT_563923 [Parathielavia appendiculata]
MSDTRALQTGSSNGSSIRSRDDWEDWEDDEVLTPYIEKEGCLLRHGIEKIEDAMVEPARLPDRRASRRISRRTSSSAALHPVQRIRTLRSLHRQKAQNEKFGIKLVTDMAKLRQQQQQHQQHIAQQMRPSLEHRESRTGKFVDAAALKALEGAPSEDSIGTLGWLRRKPTKGKRVQRLVAEASTPADLSPSAGPIMIGFAMPSDSDVVISPQTAVVETPVDFPRFFKPAKVASPNQPTSAWSPDTEDGTSPRIDERSYVPAVPSIPEHHRATDVSPLSASDNGNDFAADGHEKSYRDTVTTPIYVSDDDDDMATPVTLFEEDGSPATTQRKSLRFKGRQRSATVGSSRSTGWWDQVTSPFAPPTPQSPGSNQPKPDENQAWWRDMDKKRTFTPASPNSVVESSRGPRSTPRLQQQPPEIIIEDVSSPMPSSSKVTPPPSRRAVQPQKPRVIAEEVQTPSELPPPYSPPSQKHNIRYRAVFPAGHPLNSMYPPSPGPVPPGLSQTMTSQGAISLTEVPLTPLPGVHQARLPDRPLGSFVPGDHFTDVSGRGPRQKVERQRRRHEKEDAVVWKAGRLWHGRGCFPCCGCFGRPGREGRKRRRICLGVCIMVLLLTALGVTLGVLLSRRTAGEATAPPSRFLNLTDFPPIPTGISTVIGPESDATTACVQPPTLWSCSLPKEQADSVAPFDASQPSFVIQIQFDNDPAQRWKVIEEPPRLTPSDSNNTKTASTTTTTSSPILRPRAIAVTGFTSLVRYMLQRRDEPSSSLAFRPDPAPPSLAEMFFLGNTTDGVVSDGKAGEPTPFYISMLRSINDTVGPKVLTRRQLPNASDVAPPPALDRDGTGAPAVLLSFPTQQPLRLYDRGLPTERYGFYSYFTKTTYVKSVASLLGNGPGEGGDSSPVPADQNGGSLRTEAKFLITWLSVRYKVEIWTRMANTTRLNGKFFGGGAADVDRNGTQPGSFPYPVTITLDTHGGERDKKFVFARGVDDRQRIVLDDAKFVLVNMNTTGDLVNPRGDFDPSLGGIDGGTGGCKCERKYATGTGNMERRSNENTETGGLLTVAIETSCDDTCVAVLEKRGNRARLLVNTKVTSDNRKFGGVEPTTAVISHTAHLARLVEQALRHLSPTCSLGVQSNQRRKPDFVSVTRGPGMTASLSVGLCMAKGLAVAWQVPLVAVHHMQAHALTPRLVNALEGPTNQEHPFPSFPFLSLLVSGGHTQLLLSRSVTSHAILAESHNVAIGDMLDKCARTILPADVLASAGDVMYGALLEKFAFPPPPQPEHDDGYGYEAPAKRADEIRPYTSPTHGWFLSPPFSERRDMAYDFSGLGGQVQALVLKNPDMDVAQRQELAREAMRLAFEHLASRVIFALDAIRARASAAAKDEKQKDGGANTTTAIPIAIPKTLVISGGVASNRFLQHILRHMLRARGYPHLEIVCPPPQLCTDNAAMIAWAGMEMYEGGWHSDLSVLPVRRWSMDGGSGDVVDGEQRKKQRGKGTGGILGLPGWLRLPGAAEVVGGLPDEASTESDGRPEKKNAP